MTATKTPFQNVDLLDHDKRCEALLAAHHDGDRGAKKYGCGTVDGTFLAVLLASGNLTYMVNRCNRPGWDECIGLADTLNVVNALEIFKRLADEGKCLIDERSDDYNGDWITFYPLPKVGQGVTGFGYTDQYPYEIVAVSASGRTITLRPLDAELDESFKPEIVPGGFAGHCTNQSQQEWNYFSNEEYGTIKVRLCKKGWMNRGTHFTIGRASKFHDYNF